MNEGFTPSKIALGTVQFGINYGVANQGGQVSYDEAKKIVNKAFSYGIEFLDTAIAYGESEQILGEIGITKWKVISKLPPIPKGVSHIAKWVQESLEDSLARLNISRLYGLLLHRSQELCGPHGEVIYDALIALKKQGKVNKIGVSIYNPEELDALWPKYKFDLVQAPFNIVDRRLAVSGWLKRLNQADVEVHARSAFLQGLLLMNELSRPAAFNNWQPLWESWHAWLKENALTPLQACLGFVMSQSEIDHVVVGVDSLIQLQEILDNIPISKIEFPIYLSNNDESLINPSHWNL